MNTNIAPRRKPRTLALELVDSLGDRIRDGRLQLVQVDGVGGDIENRGRTHS